MNKAIVQFESPNGGPAKDYKLFSARLPDFLKEYPISEGYRVEVTAIDPMSSKPGLLKLYEAAISAGRIPQDVGLPPIPASETVIFKASLLDSEGRTVASASALRYMLEYKDWEKGETAARQRLIASLGFGGECFDDDEKSDMDDQGLKLAARDKAKPAKAKLKSVPDTSAAPEPKKVEDEPAVKAQPTDVDVEADSAQQTEAAEPKKVVDKPEDTVSPKATSNEKVTSDAAIEKEDIPASLTRQIEHLIKVKGVNVDFDAITTVKEARAILKKLMLA